MAYEVIWTENARADVERALSHMIDALASPQAASEHLDAFLAAASAIAEFPDSHAVGCHPALASRGLRPCFVKRYVLLYSFDGQRAIVHRVFHTLQDYARIISSPHDG